MNGSALLRSVRRGPVVWFGLLAINGAVFVYHGDPRQQLPEAKAAVVAKADAAGRAVSVHAVPSPKPTAVPDRPTAREAKAETAAELYNAGERQVAIVRAAVVHAAALAEASLLVARAQRSDDRASDKTPVNPAGLVRTPAGQVVQVHAERGAEHTFDPLIGMRTPGPVQRVETLTLKRNETAGGILERGRLQPAEAAAVLAALADHVDFRRLRPGDLFKTRFGHDDSLVNVEVYRGPLDRATAERQSDGSWVGRKIEVHADSLVANVSGEVTTSLWDALAAAGENPNLVHAIVNVFAWELDFYTEVYPGDTFRVLVEKKFVDGEFIAYGDVLAAEFVSGGVTHRGYLFADADGDPAYYDEQGHSMRRQLLKSPLKYGHVTSRYGARRHPVLGYTRKHNGVDYGVAAGTPTWSVGDGRVVRAGWHGGFGRLVEIRHANGWKSQYAHLSQIAVRVGQRVKQKQIVGRVGSSGMSTGPHLHYGLLHQDKYVNPLAQRFERAAPLSGEELSRFRSEVVKLSTELDQIRVARQPGDVNRRAPPSSSSDGEQES